MVSSLDGDSDRDRVLVGARECVLVNVKDSVPVVSPSSDGVGVGGGVIVGVLERVGGGVIVRVIDAVPSFDRLGVGGGVRVLEMVSVKRNVTVSETLTDAVPEFENDRLLSAEFDTDRDPERGADSDCDFVALIDGDSVKFTD